jgi:hypothetical protein
MFLTLILKSSDGENPGSQLVYKSYYDEEVEAPYPSRAICTSMLSTYKEFETLYMLWIGIQNYHHLLQLFVFDLHFEVVWQKSWVKTGQQIIL